MRPRYLRSWLSTTMVLAALVLPLEALLLRICSEFFDYSMSVRHSELPIAIGLGLTVLIAIALRRGDRLYRANRDLFGLQSSAVRLVEASWFGAGDMSYWTVAGVDGGAAAEADEQPLPIPRLMGDHGGKPNYGSSQSAGNAVAEPEPDSTTSAATVAATSDWIEHQVARGDTWWTLAERLLDGGHRWREIADANDGRVVAAGVRCASGDALSVGWTVIVPAEKKVELTGVEE